MPHEGYVDHVTNDGPGFHPNVPVIKLTERVTRAIEVTLPDPLFCFLVNNHSFIHSYTFIHIFIPYIQALHMQLLHHNASCCVTKW